MPRRARSILGGYAYPVLNRAHGRLRLFKKDADFAPFEDALAEAFERVPLRILGYTVMGNHWHFVVWPKQGQPDQVSEFFRWLTVTHSLRWRVHHRTTLAARPGSSTWPSAGAWSTPSVPAAAPGRATQEANRKNPSRPLCLSSSSRASSTAVAGLDVNRSR